MAKEGMGRRDVDGEEGGKRVMGGGMEKGRGM